MRLLRLLEHLGARRFGATFGELATELGVSERQIRRDLAAIEQAGHALETVPGGGGPQRVRLADERRPTIPLSAREKHALAVLRRLCDTVEPPALRDDVRTLLDKLEARTR